MKVRIRNSESWLYRMRLVLATLCVAALAALVGYKAIFGANGMKVWQSKRAESLVLEKDIERMRGEQEELQRQVDGLRRGDAAMIEKEAREQLGFVKPGEVVLFEQRAKSDPKPPAVADNIDHAAQ